MQVSSRHRCVSGNLDPSTLSDRQLSKAPMQDGLPVRGPGLSVANHQMGRPKKLGIASGNLTVCHGKWMNMAHLQMICPFKLVIFHRGSLKSSGFSHNVCHFLDGHWGRSNLQKPPQVVDETSKSQKFSPSPTLMASGHFPSPRIDGVQRRLLVGGSEIDHPKVRVTMALPRA